MCFHCNMQLSLLKIKRVHLVNREGRREEGQKAGIPWASILNLPLKSPTWDILRIQGGGIATTSYLTMNF